jgi:methylase of polypeptide subunit release factors
LPARIAQHNAGAQRQLSIFTTAIGLPMFLTPDSALISNPPYIAEDDSHLQQGDVRFEPQTALRAAGWGLATLGLSQALPQLSGTRGIY